jgi:hypothetical protein
LNVDLLMMYDKSPGRSYFRSGVSNAACVGNFAVTDGPNLVGGQRRNRDGFAVERDELDLQTSATTMKHDNSTDIATLEPVLWHIACQHYRIELFNHLDLVHSG